MESAIDGSSTGPSAVRTSVGRKGTSVCSDIQYTTYAVVERLQGPTYGFPGVNGSPGPSATFLGIDAAFLEVNWDL